MTLFKIGYDHVVKRPFSRHAIKRKDFPGFREDYLVLHSLIRMSQPIRFMEIGTSSGNGTNVICNAMDIRKKGKVCKQGNSEHKKTVYSIDVPPGTDSQHIYPDGENGHPDNAGHNCRFPYAQIYGDSTTFNFSKYYPLDGWFIDGKHSYDYVKKDTRQALKAKPKLIIWHDMQIDEVKNAVVEIMHAHQQEYKLHEVENTRIAFATKISSL